MPTLKNARHEAFAQALAAGETADAAYIAAGYKPNRHNAARLKTNEHISARVEEIMSAGARRAEIDIARALKELVRLGTSDVRRLFSDDGRLKGIQELDDDTAAAIASVEVVTKRLPSPDGEPPEVEYIHKFKMWDKNSALEKIGKHLGMFTDRIDHTSSDGSMTPRPTRIELVAPDDDSED
ncbi:terminase small subunit [Salipiger thiooxidans]|uniref:terminase small subunit n=1 Tax=Salipiger thiooxidans TaxID=282683 RepID=UPI001A8F1CBE|nr:terminase small subunit [Salipiger thiooxidans]MBN8189534.1 terminase small subunit [Salipiger thiooxidans]